MKVQKNNNFGRGWVLILALAAVAALAAGPAALAAGGSLAVTGYSVSGNVVHVSVHNSGSSAATGVLAVGVTLQSGVPAANGGVVTVAAGQTVMVAVSFVEPVSGVTEVGISDDSNPY